MTKLLTEINFETKDPIVFIDLTAKVRDVCSKSGVRDGLVNVFTQHTTSAVKINERCDRLQGDMLEMLKSLVPKKNYRHDEDTVDGRVNAKGHLMSLLMNTSETIPIVSGELLLGTWQSIFFVEFDGPRKTRSVVVKLVGE